MFLGRITPIVRSFVSIPAGVFQHPSRPLHAADLHRLDHLRLAFAGIGWAVGENWESFHHAFRYVEYAVAGLIVVGLGYLVLPVAFL